MAAKPLFLRLISPCLVFTIQFYVSTRPVNIMGYINWSNCHKFILQLIINIYASLSLFCVEQFGPFFWRFTIVWSNTPSPSPSKKTFPPCVGRNKSWHSCILLFIVDGVWSYCISWSFVSVGQFGNVFICMENFPTFCFFRLLCRRTTGTQEIICNFKLNELTFIFFFYFTYISFSYNLSFARYNYVRFPLMLIWLQFYCKSK